MIDALAAAGVLDSARSLVVDLGLGHDGWSSKTDAPDGAVISDKRAGNRAWDDQADTSAHAPSTMAQRQMDNAMAVYLTHKMIDEIKPWVLGVLSLYALWLLGKWGMRHARQRTERQAKRQRRRIHRSAQRSRRAT